MKCYQLQTGISVKLVKSVKMTAHSIVSNLTRTLASQFYNNEIVRNGIQTLL